MFYEFTVSIRTYIVTSLATFCFVFESTNPYLHTNIIKKQYIHVFLIRTERVYSLR